MPTHPTKYQLELHIRDVYLKPRVFTCRFIIEHLAKEAFGAYVPLMCKPGEEAGIYEIRLWDLGRKRLVMKQEVQ